MEDFGGLFDFHGVDFLQKLSFERQNKVKSAYLFSYVDGPPASSPLRSDSLSDDKNIKLSRSYEADSRVDEREPPPWSADDVLCASEAVEDDQFPDGELEKEQQHLIDGLVKGELLLREPPLRWPARLPRRLDAESTLRQWIKKYEVESPAEFITVHDQPMDDIRLLRKYIPSAGEQDCATGNLPGGGSSQSVGDDEIRLCASAVEDEVMQAANAVIEEAMAALFIQPSPPQRTDAAQESRPHEPPFDVESPTSQPIMPLTRGEKLRGDIDDDTKPPELADPEKTATPPSEQSGHEHRVASDSSSVTHSQDDTLSMSSTLGATWGNTVPANAGAAVAPGESSSATTGSAGHKACSLREDANSVKAGTGTVFAPLHADRMPHDFNKATLASECLKTISCESGHGAHKAIVVKELEERCFSPEDVTRKDTETVKLSHASAVHEIRAEAHRTREDSCSDRLNVVKANVLTEKKEKVAVVAPLTVGKKDSAPPHTTDTKPVLVIESEPVNFSAIFDGDWEDEFPATAETDVVIGACVSAELDASHRAVFDESSSHHESTKDRSDADDVERQKYKTGDSARRPPSKRARLPSQHCARETPPPGCINGPARSDVELGHSSTHYSGSVRRSALETYQNSSRRQATDIAEISASASPPSFGLQSAQDDVGTEVEVYCEPSQDPLSQGWSTNIFKAPLSDDSGLELCTPQRNRTGHNRRLGSPQNDSLIIDESRITLRTSSDEETYDAPMVDSRGHEFTTSEQQMSGWFSQTPQVPAKENAFRLFTGVPKDFSEEASPCSRVNLGKLKERSSATTSLPRDKISDWYRPLNGGSGHLERQARTGSSLCQENSTGNGVKAQRKSCVLNSSKLFRNKRKLGPISDQTNRITRYFPAKKCAYKMSPVHSGNKDSLGAFNLPNLNRFRYSRMEACSRRTANTGVASFSASPELEGENDFCSSSTQGDTYAASTNSIHQSQAGSFANTDWPQSADPGRYGLGRGSAAASLRTSKDTCPANVQGRSFPFGVSNYGVRTESNHHEAAGHFQVRQSALDATSRSIATAKVSGNNVRLCDGPARTIQAQGASTKRLCSAGMYKRLPPGASATFRLELPQAQSAKYQTMNPGSVTAAKRLRENGSRIVYDRHLECEAWNGSSVDEQGKRAVNAAQDDIGQNIDRGGHQQQFFHENGYKVQTIAVNRAPPVRAWRSSNLLCSADSINGQATRSETSEDRYEEIKGHKNACVEPNTYGFYEDQRLLPGNGEYEVTSFHVQDGLKEDSLNGDLYTPQQAEAVALFEGPTTDTYPCEQWSLDEEPGVESGTCGDLELDGQGAVPSNETRWGEGAAIQASEEEQECVRRLIQETLHRPAHAVRPTRSGIRAGNTARQPAIPAGSSPRRDSAAKWNRAQGSTLDAALRRRQPEGVAAAPPASVQQGTDRSAEHGCGGARGSSLGWLGPLNVKNLAAKLVAPPPLRKQLDENSVRQLLKPKKSNIMAASDFLSIRKVKPQSSEAGAKSPKL